MVKIQGGDKDSPGILVSNKQVHHCLLNCDA